MELLGHTPFEVLGRGPARRRQRHALALDPLMSLLERIHSPADLKALVAPRARPAGGRDPPRHHPDGGPARRPSGAQPGRGRADAGAPPRVRLARATRSSGTSGHQSYPHKLVTGRFERFDTLRSLGGLARLPGARRERARPVRHLPRQHLDLGGARLRGGARPQGREPPRGGGDRRRRAHRRHGVRGAQQRRRAGQAKMLVILNDNEWSISPNVGAIARYLTRLTTQPLLPRSSSATSTTCSDACRSLGRKAQVAARRIKEGLSEPGGAGVLFEELGLKYYGPLDGHDLDLLIHTLNELKEVPGPVLLHVVTKKGKGYAPAESDAGTFHGVGVFDPETGATSKSSQTHLHAGVRRDRGRDRGADAERGGGHRGDDRQHRSQAVRQAVPGALLRRRHGRGARRHVLGRPGRRRADPAHRHLLHVPAARLSTRSSTTWRCRTCTWCSAIDRAGLVGEDGRPAARIASTSASCA